MPIPDPAATVLALRPSSDGFEVLMVHRNSRGYFGDLAVFPGGRVEDMDVPDGGTSDDDLSHRNAAVREFAEETGIMITDEGVTVAPDVRGEQFYTWLSDESVSSGAGRLVLVSRWVTPELAPRRFDTRFYVVDCVDPPDVAIDSDELVGHEWVTPGSALERHEAGAWNMFRPTLAHLRWLQRWPSIDEAIGSAEGAESRTLTIPDTVEDGSLLPIQMPADRP